MIKILLILLLIHYLGFLIVRNKPSIITCGLFAWFGKNPKKFDKSKFDLLGSYNEKRGIDSCGVFVDGDIYNGIDKQKIYRDFIIDTGYKSPSLYPTVIGHTRKSTFGKHTIDNAHPFGFGHVKKGEDLHYSFVGVHNGTLLNHKELAKNFNVKPTAKISKRQTREKIDSEVLLEAIYRNKSWKVLEEYNGAAALIFCNVKEPNVVYCYHGAARKERKDLDNPIFIERPLFYWKQTRNSLYVSSMEESLIAIGGTNNTIGEFLTNTVYKITNGNVEKAEKITIKRATNFINKTYGQNSDFRIKLIEPPFPYKRTNAQVNLDLNEDENVHFLNDSYTNESSFNIFGEQKPIITYKDEIYFQKLRFWKEGQLISGIYSWIKDYGYYYLGENIKDVQSHYNMICNKKFFKGAFIFTDTSFTSEDIYSIPFKPGISCSINAPLFYFKKGVQVSTFQDYSAISNNSTKEFNWEQLSYCSVYPVIDISEKNSADAQNILFKGKLVNDTICPLGSDRIYTITAGNCIYIEKKKFVKIKEKEEGKIISSFTDVTTALNKNEDEIQQNEKEIKKNSIKSDDFIEGIIDEIFKDSLATFPLALKRLENYVDHVDAMNAYTIIESFLDELNALINLEPR